MSNIHDMIVSPLTLASNFALSIENNDLRPFSESILMKIIMMKIDNEITLYVSGKNVTNVNVHILKQCFLSLMLCQIIEMIIKLNIFTLNLFDIF